MSDQGRDWLHVGAKVGVAAGGHLHSYRVGEVERFTKTRVVLTDGSWFRLDDLRSPNRDSWAPTAMLVPTTDPAFRKGLLRQQMGACAEKVYGLARSLGRVPGERDLLELQRAAEQLASKCHALRGES